MFEAFAVLAQTDIALTQVSPGEVVAGMMILSAAAGSLLFWVQWLRNPARLEQVVFPAAEAGAEEAGGRFVLPPAAYLFAILSVVVMVGLKLASGTLPESETPLDEQRLLTGLLLDLGLQLLIYVVLGLATLSGVSPAAWRSLRIGNALLAGLGGFVAAVGPVLLLMVVSQPLRSETSEHLFLRILREAQSPLIVALICLSAAVVAPLSEELTYRVALMGGSERWIGRVAALLGSSLIFAGVHGFPDMLALIPLALILGWIYQRTGSYIAIVTTHALFNSFNLIMVLSQTWF